MRLTLVALALSVIALTGCAASADLADTTDRVVVVPDDVAPTPEVLAEASLAGDWVLSDLAEDRRVERPGGWIFEEFEPSLAGTFSLGEDGIWTTPVCGDQGGTYSYDPDGSWSGDGGRLTLQYCFDDPTFPITSSSRVELINGVLTFFGEDGAVLRSAVRV